VRLPAQLVNSQKLGLNEVVPIRHNIRAGDHADRRGADLGGTEHIAGNELERERERERERESRKVAIDVTSLSTALTGRVWLGGRRASIEFDIQRATLHGIQLQFKPGTSRSPPVLQ